MTLFGSEPPIPGNANKPSNTSKRIAADGHEYHVSATANATVAPTNEATLEAAIPGSKLGHKKLDFINVLHMEYMKTGKVNHDLIRPEYGYSDETYSELLKDVGVIRALIDRGVPAKHLTLQTNKDLKSPLTAKQIMAAASLMNLVDTRTVKKKLQDIGVSSTEYAAWLRDPVFREYMQGMGENLIGDNQHEAMLALMDKVTAGDMKAITLYLELTGRYVPANAQNTGPAVGDFQQFIVRVIEIIVDEVDDQDTAMRIADRLKATVMGNQVAGLLEPPPVIIPEVAQSRVITPEIQELMERGAGFND